MPWSPGHADRAANVTVNGTNRGKNAHPAAGLNRATGAIRAEADAHDHRWKERHDGIGRRENSRSGKSPGGMRKMPRGTLVPSMEALYP
jgi:hypothetical protein